MAIVNDPRLNRAISSIRFPNNPLLNIDYIDQTEEGAKLDGVSESTTTIASPAGGIPSLKPVAIYTGTLSIAKVSTQAQLLINAMATSSILGAVNITFDAPNLATMNGYLFHLNSMPSITMNGSDNSLEFKFTFSIPQNQGA